MSLAELRARIGEEPVEGPSTICYLGWKHLVWRRFRRHPLALAGAAMLAVVLLIVIVGPSIAPPPPPLDRPGLLSPSDVAEITHHDASPTWSWRYLLGTDENAMPVLRAVLVGGSAPLQIGFIGALLAAIIGIVSGAISGYLGGFVDAFWMRVADSFLAMPFIPLILLATTSLNLGELTGAAGFAVLYGLLGWPAVARLVRGYVLSLREWSFVDAARAMGVSTPAIVFRHILPNILGILVISFTLNIAVFISVEVTIEFLTNSPLVGGLTWGQEVHTGYSTLLVGEWWVVVFPGIMVLLAVLGVNLLGDGLRDAIDASASEPLEVRIAVPRRHLPAFVGRARAALLSLGSRLTHVLTPLAAGLRRRVSGRRIPVPAVPAAWLRLPIVGAVPLAAAFVIVGVVFLAGHAPVTSPSHFTSPPAQIVTVLPGSSDAVTAVPGGGPRVLAVQPGRRIVFATVSGGIEHIQPLERANGAVSAVAVASSGNRTLGVWLESGGHDALRAAYAGAVPFTLLSAAAGTIGHPFLVALPGGGFGLLFERAAPSGKSIDLATIPPGDRVPVRIVPVVRPADLAVLPRAVVDGGGAIDLLELERCCNAGVWKVVLRRFTPRGVSLSAPATVASITSLTPFGARAARVPASWGLDVARAPNGSVWWPAIADGAGGETNAIYAGHLSARGATELPPTQLDCAPLSGCDMPQTSDLALAATRDRELLFYIYDTGLGIHPYETTLNPYGLPLTGERIAYDYGGGSRAIGVVRAGDQVTALWQKTLYTGQAVLEDTTYRARVPLDIPARLGINVGPVLANAIVLVAGSLLGAIPIAAVNVLLVALLLLLWGLVGRVAEGGLRWTLYLALCSGVLAWAFALRSSPPAFVFVLPAWPAPYGPLAVLGAVFVAGWSGITVLRGQEAWLRAAGMATLAVFFLATLEAALVIQGQLAQI